MTESLFYNYDKDIERAEYKNFYPTSTSNLNKANQRTSFQVESGDRFVGLKWKFLVKGELTKNTGEAYPAKTAVKLVNNFFPHLFSSADVKLNGKSICRCENVGTTSSMKQYITYTKDDNSYAEGSGLVSYFQGGGKFHILINLADFGLGFFEDITTPLCNVLIELGLVRNSDNDAILLSTTKKADGSLTDLPTEGKITITDICIKVPFHEYSINSKIQIIKHLNESGGYELKFKDWQCIQQKNVSGSSSRFDLTNMYNNSAAPMCIVVGLQRDKLNDQTKDPSLFHHSNIKNIYVKINDRSYPDELTDLDFKTGDCMQAFDMFKHFRQVFYGDSSNFITVSEFINERPLFVIDTSRQPLNISSGPNNIILHIDYNEPIAASTTSDGTICNILMISLKQYQLNIIDKQVREL